MDLGLADATAAVVGGSSGMGLATARCLAEDGARLAVIGRTKATLDNAVTDLTDRGSPDALGLVADIADTAQVEKVFAELSERWDGELNVLINTVGPGAPGLFEDLTDEQWRQSVEDAVLGMVRCVRSALPLLPTRRPSRC
jgi:3-oxoacyl-[acyl-carrier protein] reductase